MKIYDTMGMETYRLVMLIKRLMQTKGPFLTHSDMMRSWLMLGECSSDFNKDMIDRYRSRRHLDIYNFSQWSQMSYDEIFARL